VFELLSAKQWKIKLSKCTFAQNLVSYLGHVISDKGVATDPDKVAAISSWPVPHNVKEVHSFLGLSGYYRKFVKHFYIISRPLTNLLKKGPLFVWTTEHDQTFSVLKCALVQALFLILPNLLC
jgi:hypothetical protein